MSAFLSFKREAKRDIFFTGKPNAIPEAEFQLERNIVKVENDISRDRRSALELTRKVCLVGPRCASILNFTSHRRGQLSCPIISVGPVATFVRPFTKHEHIGE